MEPIGCPEALVRNYHYLLRNNPEEYSSRGLDLSNSGLGRVRVVVDMEMNFRIPHIAGNFLITGVNMSLWMMTMLYGLTR